jgi:PhnB protein
MPITPYLVFNGHCDEALEFYRKTLHAEVTMLMRFKDNPEPPPAGCLPAGIENHVMHSEVHIGDAVIMCSDGAHTDHPSFQGFSLNLSFSDVAHSQKAFNALAEAGGKILMPFGKTFYSPGFGMVTDRFGVSWMLYTIPPAK